MKNLVKFHTRSYISDWIIFNDDVTSCVPLLCVVLTRQNHNHRKRESQSGIKSCITTKKNKEKSCSTATNMIEKSASIWTLIVCFIDISRTNYLMTFGYQENWDFFLSLLCVTWLRFFFISLIKLFPCLSLLVRWPVSSDFWFTWRSCTGKIFQSLSYLSSNARRIRTKLVWCLKVVSGRSKR